MRIDHDDHQLLKDIESPFLLELTADEGLLQKIEHTPDADVVGNAAVDEVQ